MMLSQQWFERAKAALPGGVSSPVRSFKHVGVPPVYFEKAEGPFLFDVDGKTYTDFNLAFGPHLLGHSPLAVRQALHLQIDQATCFGACHPKEVQLAHWVLKAFPFLDQVRWLNSGTEAVMTAIRLARGFTGRPKIVQFEGCYHGHSDGLLAKAGSGVAFLSESSSSGVPPSIVQETLVARLDDPQALSRLFSLHGHSIAALVVEPVPANNGLWVPARKSLEFIMRTAREHGAVTIFDEVVSGFRLSLSGASGLYDLQPDLITLGKIVGGGLPVAAVVGRRAIMQHLAPEGNVYQAGTLAGNPLGMAAGCAVMEQLFADPPYARLAEKTAWFARELENQLSKHGPVQVKSIGSIFWIHFGPAHRSFPPDLSTDSRKQYTVFFQKALNRGVYLPPSPYEVGFLSTEHTQNILQDALDKLVECAD